ncbi:MAG: hypothetical protein G01um10145_52 [Microgenomates group bacterium Gr01-1014_5]|nr:MAG: hypothetical protein G01um10145_52 [Microgenomates group bacterium Gr01-1014_5]
MPDFVNSIYQFFNHPFFIIFGGVASLLVLTGFLLNFVFWLLGLWPLLWRLGYGRWSRKIAIVAKADVYADLKKVLVKSGVFREGNVFHISSTSLSEVKESDMLLVHYQSFNEPQNKTILANKRSSSGMIFYFPEYAPQQGIKISDAMLKRINDEENTTVVNFRGRLLNDIITTLITTSYEK